MSLVREAKNAEVADVEVQIAKRQIQPTAEGFEHQARHRGVRREVKGAESDRFRCSFRVEVDRIIDRG